MFGLQSNLVNIALSLPLVLAGTLVGSVGLKPVLLLLALLVLAGAASSAPGSSVEAVGTKRRCWYNSWSSRT